jgi:type IV secretion system protein VirB6
MFTQLGVWVTSFLSGYVAAIVADLCGELVPIAAAWLTIYIALYGLAVMRGEASESFTVFGWKLVKKTFIFSFALSAGTYMSVIVDNVIALQGGLATLFLSTSGDTNNVTPTTVFGALDTANNIADNLLQLLWQDAGWYRLDLLVASVLFSLGTGLFMFAGTIVALIANVVLTWMLAIGPLFILALMFEQTSKFFDAWLSSIASAVLIATFAFFMLGLAFYVENQLILVIKASQAFTANGTVNAVSAALTYLILMAVLAYILMHAHEYASALTGGAAIQHGSSMVASYLGMRLAGAGRGSEGQPAGGQGGGGSVRAGGGAAYGTGHAMGLATRDVARGVGVAGGAVASGIRYAYQRVAARGRRA